MTDGKKFIIVGLGNPGEKYLDTRHNAGFMVLDKMMDESSPNQLNSGGTSWIESGSGQALFAKGFVGENEIVFLKPQGFMNNSGTSVSYFLEKEGVLAENLVVIHDDLDLPLGKFKVSFDRNPAGHNGVSSIVEKIGGKNFGRIRIGISPTDEEGNIRKPDNSESFVLKKFSPAEKEKLNGVLENVLDCLAVYVGEGREKAMNKFN